MTRQLFDTMIGTSPVSTVDVDAVIAREREMGRRRRTAVVVACAAVVFALLVGGRAVLRPRSSFGVNLGPQATPSHRAAPSASPSPTPGSPSRTGSPTATRRPAPTGDPAVRLGDAMRGAVQKAVPGAELLGIGSSRPFDIDRLGNGTASPGGGGGDYSGQAVVRAGSRAGRVVITVYRGDGPQIPTAGGDCTSIPGHPCPVKAGTGPDGERYAGYQRVIGKGVIPDKPDFQATENWVDLRRPDGTVVYAMANNMVFTSDLHLAPGSAQPALTVEQLIAVALDANLDI